MKSKIKHDRANAPGTVCCFTRRLLNQLNVHFMAKGEHTSPYRKEPITCVSWQSASVQDRTIRVPVVVFVRSDDEHGDARVHKSLLVPECIGMRTVFEHELTRWCDGKRRKYTKGALVVGCTHVPVQIHGRTNGACNSEKQVRMRGRAHRMSSECAYLCSHSAPP